MKKLINKCAPLFVAALISSSALAFDNKASVVTKAMEQWQSSQISLMQAQVQMIDWQENEFHRNRIQFIFGGGESLKYVRNDEPALNAFWFVQEMSLMGQQNVSEALVRRSDGQLLRLIVNGEEQDLGDGDSAPPEIIDQYETTVTVPAGTFNCIYVKLRVQQGGETQELELWVNPYEVNLDGTLKTVVKTQFGPLTMSLREFGKL